MPDPITSAADAVVEAAHDAAQEAAEAAIEAAEERAEAAEEARDLLAEAALRDEIGRHVAGLRSEFETCRASHEARISELQGHHDSLKASHESLSQQVADLSGKMPVVAPLISAASAPAATTETAEAEAEQAVEGLVVIPAAAAAAEVPLAAPASRRKGRFL